MTSSGFDRIRGKVRRNLQLDLERASLGDANGTVYVQGRPGYAWVRKAAADGQLTAPVQVRMRGTFTVAAGAPVLLGYDTDGELAILESDFSGQLQAGYDPRKNNPADTNIYAYVNQRDILTLRCQAVPNSLSVSIKAWVYVDAAGIIHEYTGDILTLVAPAANQHYLALVSIDTSDNAAVTYSTAQDITDPLDETDVQEALDGRYPGSTPVAIWRLKDAQTTLSDSDLYYDIRQFVDAVRPREKRDATAAPTTSDDELLGYEVGSTWFDVTNDKSYVCLDASTGTAVWKETSNAAGGGTGTVTSVGLALPAEFTVSGTPVTVSGTLTGAWASATGNRVFAAPDGAPGTPAFRALVAADIPNLNASKITAGTLGVAQGGTGAATFAANNVLLGNTTSAFQVVAPSTTGNLLTSNGTTWQSTAPSFAASVITSGTLGLARGGTGADLSATGGANQFVKQTSAGGVFTVAGILSADLTTALTTPPAIGGTTPGIATFSPSVTVTASAANTLANLYNYGASSIFQGFTAGGTSASPTATPNNTALFNLSATGHDGSAFAGSSNARIVMQAAELFSVSAQGTRILFSTTRATTTTRTDVLTIGDTGVLTSIINTTATAANTDVWTINLRSTGTAAASFGAGILFNLESNTTNDQNAARIKANWNVATDASRSGQIILSAYYTSTERNIIQGRANSARAAIGFLGATPVEAPDWAAWTGTASRVTRATATATLEQCAQAIKALTDDLLAYGLLR